MATVGQQLTSPESGWARYDETNANIKYLGTTWSSDTSYSPYGGSRKVSSALNSDACRFNFTGPSVRIIGTLASNWCSVVQITIDGVSETFSQNGSTMSQVLNYSKIGLSNSEHYVSIMGIGGGDLFGIDAIDIDSGGALKAYNDHITKAQILSGGM